MEYALVLKMLDRRFAALKFWVTARDRLFPALPRRALERGRLRIGPG